MSKKSIKCLHCHKKTPIENPICINCSRLLESKLKEENNKKNILPFILVILIISSIIIYILNNKKEYITNKKIENTVIDFNSSIKNVQYDNNYHEDMLIYTKYNNSNVLINKKGKIIEKDIAKLIGNYNDFIIFNKKDGNYYTNYIIDNKGKILYQTNNRIIYYPKTNTYLIGNKLYNNKKEVFDNITLDEGINYSGYYFSYKNNNEGGIIDYKGNIVYKTDVKDFLYLESPSINEYLDSNYCLVNKDYKYAIINCKTGKIIINYTSNIIKELNNNIYEINNNIFYLSNNEKKIYYKKEYDEVNFNSFYYGNNNLLLGRRLINTKTNSDSNNPDISNTSIEKDNKLNRVICKNNNIYYGLNKDNNSLLPCSYDNILFFNDVINDYLKKNNKLYTILIKDGKTSLYNINNKKLIDRVEAISLSSPIIVYNENNLYYAYNLYNDTFLTIPNYSKVIIHNNALEVYIIDDKNTSTIQEIYDLNLNKISISE